MASYVKTRFEVYGKKNDVQKFIAFISSETSDFDFNNVIPMPKELDMDFGTAEMESLVYYCMKNGLDPKTFDKLGSFTRFTIPEMEKRFREIGKEPEEYYKLGEQYYKNYQKYGYTSWYSWCIEHWGTKWNALNIDFNGMYPINPETDKYAANYEFDTVWTEPFAVFEEIIEKFPELEFEMVSAGENYSEATIVRGKDGELDFDEFEGDKAHDMAVEIWGYDPDEEEEEC